MRISLKKSSNKCWICSNVHAGGVKVRDDHVTGKCRGSAHKDCNIHLRLT